MVGQRIALPDPDTTELPVMPRQRRAMPDAAVLWDRFIYKPLTGEIISKAKPSTKRHQPGKCKYLSTSISINGVTETWMLHQLIWKWCHGADPAHTIDHINRDRSDNRIWNLRDATYTTQLRNHGGCRLNVEKVREIKRRLATGEFCRLIAADYGVSAGAIFDIKRGKNWQSVEAG